MKSINEYLINKSNKHLVGKREYSYQPKTYGELKELVDELIKERGNNADLNDIDTSLITNMWSMFYDSEFNGDISEWDVSKVENMASMFGRSVFTGDISEWDVSNVKDMNSMFSYSEFNGDISGWDVSNVENMGYMFSNSKFNQDISKWDVNHVTYGINMYNKCPIKDKYKPKFN